MFRLSGTFEPDEVTEKLGSAPIVLHIKGGLRGERSGRRWEHDHWALTSEEVASDRIATHLNWLLDRIEPRAEQLAEFRTPDVSAVLDPLRGLRRLFECPCRRPGCFGPPRGRSWWTR